MNSSQEKAIRIALNIEIPIDGTAPRVNLAHAAPLLSSPSNTISIPTLTQPALVSYANAICVKGQAQDSNGMPPLVVYAKIYTEANLPDPIPSTPDTPNTSTTVIDSAGNYVFEGVPMPSSGSTNYAVVTWAEFTGYPPTYLAIDRVFTASAPGPYTDCSYPGALRAAAVPFAKSMSTAEMEVAPAAWTVKITGFSGGAVQVFNGERKLNLVKSAQHAILYCNGGDGATMPQVQLRCDQPGTTDWELSFVLGQKRITYRQPSTRSTGTSRKLFQNPVTMGLSESDGMPAVVSVQPV